MHGEIECACTRLLIGDTIEFDASHLSILGAAKSGAAFELNICDGESTPLHHQCVVMMNQHSMCY